MTAAESGPTTADVSPPVVACSGLSAGYDRVEVLHAVDLTVGAGEAVALLGHNGAGKTTLLKAMMGLLPGAEGEIRLHGDPVAMRSPRAMLRHGVAYVPQGNGIFPQLSVAENVEMGVWAAGRKVAQAQDSIDRVQELAPMLKTRWRSPAGQLSGGQRQLVSIARAIVAEPTLLLLDEPTVGLAPRAAELIVELLETVQASTSLAVLIVEQNVRLAAAFADRVYVLRRGSLIHEGPAAEAAAMENLWHLF
jgi:ABC-type branched-subunit amino acid transport system ATPase component